jgi:hypothetical protein
MLTLRGDNASLVIVDNGETVREVKGLSGSQERKHIGPDGLLESIRKQVHDNGGLLGSLQDGEQVLSGNPSFINSLLVGLTLTLTDDNVDTVITEVKSLSTTLRTVSEDGNGVILEGLEKLLLGDIGTLVDSLLGTTEVEGLVATDLLGDLCKQRSKRSSQIKKCNGEEEYLQWT